MRDILICPLCGYEKKGDDKFQSCCGEPPTNFELVEEEAQFTIETMDDGPGYPIGYSEAIMRESGH